MFQQLKGGLSELENDALTEIFNISIGRAAAVLRAMVGEFVELSVPKVEVIAQAQAVELLRQRDGERIVAVKQSFEGDLSGRAFLIFPEATSLSLIRAVVDASAQGEGDPELEAEALAETGNVVLSTCIATMADLFAKPLQISLPDVLRADVREIFEEASAPDNVVIFVSINFTIRQRQIAGYVAIAMDVGALANLAALLDAFVARISADYF